MKIQGIAPIAGLALLLFAAACDDSSGDAEPVPDDAAVSTQEFRSAMNDMRTGVRTTLDEFGTQISELDQHFQSANREMAQEWTDTREGLSSYRQNLEANLARLDDASAGEVDQITGRMASDLEELTQRVERAELKAVEGSSAFVSAVQDRLSRLDQDFLTLEQEAQRLPMDARHQASENVQEFNETAGEIRMRVDRLARASSKEVSEARGEIAEDMSSLTASVRRELFEARRHRTMVTTMDN